MAEERKEIDNLIGAYKRVEISGGRTTAQLIDVIDSYYNSEFLSGKTDSDGFRKYFFNIVKPKVDIASKQLDFDTKDVRVVAEEGGDPDVAFLFQHELRQWMKEHQFGETINKIVRDAPKYGSVFVKKVGNDVMVVNPANLIFDPEARNIEQTPLIEVHRMTEREFRDAPWVDDDVDVGGVVKRADGDLITIFEFYNPRKDKRWDREFLEVVHPVTRQKDEETGGSYNSLKKGDVSELPYKQADFDSVRGRLLGVGVIEVNIDSQVRVNEAINLQAKALHWKSRQVYQTRDEIVQRNLLTDVDNGDIIRVESEITPIGKDNADLVAFREEIERWSQRANDLSFAREVITGETLPSRTPFRQSALLAQAAGSHFDYKREALGFLIKEIIYDWLIPVFKKDKEKEHMVTFIGQGADTDRIARWRADARVLKGMVNMLKGGGVFDPLEVRAEQIRVQLEERQSEEKTWTVPSEYYNNLKFRVDISITGESVDLGAKLNILNQMLNIVGTNPAILQNPAAMNLIQRIADVAGISIEGLSGGGGQPVVPQVDQQSGSPPAATAQGITSPNQQSV